MSRSRNIKPAFFLNENLSKIDFSGRLLFIGLWTIADRDGKLEDRPLRIKAQIFPYEPVDVDKLLNKLSSLGFIERYSLNSSSYIKINNFNKHQNPHIREAESTIPDPEASPRQCLAPDKASPRQCLAPDKASPRSPDSLLLIPDSLQSDSLPMSNKFSQDDWVDKNIDKGLKEVFIEFISVRKRLKAVNSEFSFNLLKNSLEKALPGERRSMIEQSIVNGWKGLFPLKKTFAEQRLSQKDIEFNKDLNELMESGRRHRELIPKELRDGAVKG